MDPGPVSRRRLLGSIAAVSTGGALAGVRAVSAGDDGDDTCDSADDTGDSAGDAGDSAADQPHVNTADHFELQADGAFVTTTGNTPTNYDTKGVDFPWNANELVVHLHAWNATYEAGLIRSNRARSAYDDIWYYDPATVGVTWGSTYRIELLEAMASVTAPKVANFLATLHRWNPDVDIRLQGFSAGATLLAETLAQLDEWGERDVVTTAIFLAGALPEAAVSLDGEYGGPIQRTVAHAENFWDGHDSILRYRFWSDANRGAIGNEGSSGPTPENFTDHEVTGAIDGHEYLNWLDPEFLGKWVVPEVVDHRNFGLQVDPGGNGFSGVRSG